MVPASSKYISLKYKDILPESSAYKSLQELVYLDLLKNTESYIYPQKKISIYTFGVLSEKILGVNPSSAAPEILKTTNTTVKDIEKIRDIVSKRE